MPCYWLPGNHDIQSVMLPSLLQQGLAQTRQIISDHWQIIMLDSQVEGVVYGEMPEEVVKREALEEAGLTIKSCKFITNYLVSPGGTTEQIDLFIADVDSSLAGGIHGLEDEGEDIRVHVLPRETAYQWVIDGKINNAATIIALQWLELNRGNGLQL